MHRRAQRVAPARVGVLHRCVLHVASARVTRCMLQMRSRPAAHGRALRCVVSAARALLDWAKVLHVVTRYALYAARRGLPIPHGAVHSLRVACRGYVELFAIRCMLTVWNVYNHLS
jgi:hypothetical protein